MNYHAVVVLRLTLLWPLMILMFAGKFAERAILIAVARLPYPAA